MPAKRTASNPTEMLQRLESRHEDLLGRIDDLNVQIEKALAEITGDGAEEPPSSDA